LFAEAFTAALIEIDDDGPASSQPKASPFALTIQPPIVSRFATRGLQDELHEKLFASERTNPSLNSNNEVGVLRRGP
jgi:hypothetical protein